MRLLKSIGVGSNLKLNVLGDTNDKRIAFQYGIMSTPTLVFFCGGRPIEEDVGFMTTEQLEKKLNDLLGRYRKCAEHSTELKLAL